MLDHSCSAPSTVFSHLNQPNAIQVFQGKIFSTFFFCHYYPLDSLQWVLTQQLFQAEQHGRITASAMKITVLFIHFSTVSGVADSYVS